MEDDALFFALWIGEINQDNWVLVDAEIRKILKWAFGPGICPPIRYFVGSNEDDFLVDYS